MSSGSDDPSSESDSESEMKDDVQTLNDERNETLTKKLLGENIFKQKHYELEEAEYARLTNIHKQNAVQTKNNEKYMRQHDSFILGTINNRDALKNLRDEIREQLNVGDTPNLIDTGESCSGRTDHQRLFKQVRSCAREFVESFRTLREDIVKTWGSTVKDASKLRKWIMTFTGNNKVNFKTALENIDDTKKQQLLTMYAVYKNVHIDGKHMVKQLDSSIESYMDIIFRKIPNVDVPIDVPHPLIQMSIGLSESVTTILTDVVHYNTDKQVAWRLAYRYLPEYLRSRAGAIMESIVSTSDCLTDSITLLNHISKLLDDRKVFEAKQAFVNFLGGSLCTSAKFFEVAARIVENESDRSAKVAAHDLRNVAIMWKSSLGRGGESKSNTNKPLYMSFTRMPFSNIQVEWIEFKHRLRQKAIASDKAVFQKVFADSTSEDVTMDYDVCRTHQTLDKIMNDYVGLEDVKRQCFDLYKNRLAMMAESKSARPELSLNFQFLGNPGTGKTTMARLVSDFLFHSRLRPATKPVSAKRPDEYAGSTLSRFAPMVGGLLGPMGYSAGQAISSVADATRARKIAEYELELTKATPEPYFVEESAASLLIKNAEGLSIILKDMVAAGGGVLFVDEAYGLDPKHSEDGRIIFDLLLTYAENHRDVLTIILAGYKEDMEKNLLSFNPGLARRFPAVFHFEDYSDNELYSILQLQLRATRDSVEKSQIHGWDMSDAVARVMIRHIASQRGTRGFGNAGTVRNALQRAIVKTTARLNIGLSDDVSGIVDIKMEDVIGPDPSNNAQVRACLDELDRFVGLEEVKDFFKKIVNVSNINWKRETACLEPFPIGLNRLFVGKPGTGKSSMAALYSRLLKALNVLSDGEVKLTVASDYIGGVVGESIQKTSNILQMSIGKVLVIDEAYVLSKTDYGLQVLDTIVERVSASPGADMAVILAGYEDEMMKMCREVNPGLGRRFDVDHPVVFHDFDNVSLERILKQKCDVEGMYCSAEVARKAIEKLAMQRSQPTFGNAGAVDNLLSNAKLAALQRSSNVSGKLELKLEDFGIVASLSAKDILKEMEKNDSCPALTQHLTEIANAMENYNEQFTDKNFQVPGHYVFMGNSGTGKTETAKEMGKLFFQLQILSSDRVVVVSAPQLNGTVVGEAQQLVRKKMEEALGGTLLIDEAYELGRGQYGIEAQTQLIAMLEEDKYKRNIIVILAGYEPDMRKMMQKNQGMESRFENQFIFDDWSDKKCMLTVQKMLEEQFKSHLTSTARSTLTKYIRSLKAEAPFANGRGCRNLANKLSRFAMSKGLKVVSRFGVQMFQISTEIMTSYIETYGGHVAEEKVADAEKKAKQKKVANPDKKGKRNGKRRNRVLQYNPKMYEF